MSAPRNVPCDPWIDWDDLARLCACTADLTDLTDEQKANALEVATELLWLATGRRYGACTGTYEVSRCGCPRDACVCGCDGYDRLRLPRTPVVSVTSVVVDGVVLAADAYRVDDWTYLTSLDNQPWARCVTVTFVYGETVPLALQVAAARVACELAKSCSAGPCNLPEGIEILNREGVTLHAVNADDLDLGRGWGIPSVERAIAAWGGKVGADGGATGFFDPLRCGTARRIDTAAPVTS